MKALLLVDVQNDFLPGGSLAVTNGDQILPVVNQLTQKDFDVIVATKDWHPSGHGSFASTHGKEIGEHIQLNGLDQILWPDHCIQDTEGAEFSPNFETTNVQKVFYKGIDSSIDSYSTFYDNGHKRKTGLDDFLKEKGVKEIYIAGLATDYCVKYSVLDALKLGYTVHVIRDACRAVNLEPNDETKALQEMKEAGANIISSTQV